MQLLSSTWAIILFIAPFVAGCVLFIKHLLDIKVAKQEIKRLQLELARLEDERRRGESGLVKPTSKEIEIYGYGRSTELARRLNVPLTVVAFLAVTTAAITGWFTASVLSDKASAALQAANRVETELAAAHIEIVALRKENKELKAALRSKQSESASTPRKLGVMEFITEWTAPSEIKDNPCDPGYRLMHTSFETRRIETNERPFFPLLGSQTRKRVEVRQHVICIEE